MHKLKIVFYLTWLFIILGIPGYVLATHTHSAFNDPFYEQQLVITRLEAKVAELESDLEKTNRNCGSPILLDPVYAYKQNIP